MKKQFILIAAAVTIAFTSCKKENGTNTSIAQTSSARIKTETGNGAAWTHTYDAQGRVITQFKNGVKKYDFEYTPGKVKETYANNGNTTVILYELNSDGLVVKETAEGNPDYLATRIYNSQKQVVKLISINGGNTTTFDYFYSNGNCDSVRISGDNGYQSTIKRTYYTDRANHLDYGNYGQSFYGVKSKNLPKTEQYFFNNGSTNDIVTATYEFNDKGLPTKRTEQWGANIEIMYYTFE